MALLSLTGKDTLKINGKICNDLGDGDCVVVDYPNDVATVKVGKNGNAIMAENANGKVAVMTVSTIRGGSTDRMLNGYLKIQEASFTSALMLTALAVKRIGHGIGITNADSLILAGGIFTKKPSYKDNVEGDTTQALAVYTITFTSSNRAIL